MPTISGRPQGEVVVAEEVGRQIFRTHLRA